MGIFVLTKEFRFEASHRLINHDGKCRKLHGHSFKGTVYVDGNTLVESGPKRNMVMDYTDIKKVLNPMVETYLDHNHLNWTLDTDMPTSEFIARWVYDHLKKDLPGLVAVCIEETCTSSCTYYGEEEDMYRLPQAEA